MSEADRLQLETERVTIRDSAFSFITGALHESSPVLLNVAG